MSHIQSMVFFAYPSTPNLRRETVVAAASKIDGTGGAQSYCWEELRIGGRIVISEILSAIDQSDLLCCEVTELNHNVMFELGYAVGSKKNIWLIRDSTFKDHAQLWKRLPVLSQIGYIPFRNSDDIQTAFLKEMPHQYVQSIFESLIQPSLRPAGEPTLLLIKGPHETDAERKLTRRVLEERSKGLRPILDDAQESKVQTLIWYAQHIHSSHAVVAHFCSSDKIGWQLHNAKAAFVCGLAVGMKRAVLMLAEEGYELPFDYQDKAYVYRSSTECFNYADVWLSSKLQDAHEEVAKSTAAKNQYELITELRDLRLGEHIAENEEDELGSYFVETRSYADILNRKMVLFVGKKGSGKTANFIQAAQSLRLDKRNLVCTIQPVAYELSGLMTLLSRFKEKDSKGYLVESFWKYLLYSEMAWAAAQAMPKEAMTPDTPEWQLLKFLTSDGGLAKDFAVRLERAVESLSGIEDERNVETQRLAISEALHKTVIRDLRILLGNALHRRERVAVLVDNLDKAWATQHDLGELAELLLGLFDAVRSITRDLQKSDAMKKPVAVTLAIFVRQDIFGHIISAAGEPDKLPVTHIVWEDKDLLLRVLEERFVATRENRVQPEELWTKYFCRNVRGEAPKQYIVERILPRPRDIVFFANSAITNAVNRGHSVVEESDIMDAEKSYSQFAFEATLVQNGLTANEMEQVLYEFIGCGAVVDVEEIREKAIRAKISLERLDSLIEHLCDCSFLGLETEKDIFVFRDDPRFSVRNSVAAEKYAKRQSAIQRYKIHSAFWQFLSIEE